MSAEINSYAQFSVFLIASQEMTHMMMTSSFQCSLDATRRHRVVTILRETRATAEVFRCSMFPNKWLLQTKLALWIIARERKRLISFLQKWDFDANTSRNRRSRVRNWSKYFFKKMCSETVMTWCHGHVANVSASIFEHSQRKRQKNISRTRIKKTPRKLWWKCISAPETSCLIIRSRVGFVLKQWFSSWTLQIVVWC